MNFIIILLSLLVLINCEDYCSICKDHIGCENDGKFDQTCSDKVSLIDLDATKIKDNLIEMHNTIRNNLAFGKLQNLESATRMATMKWDNELAKLAELNIKTCLFQHDKCHNTKQFHHSGQNLGRLTGSEAIYPQQAAKTIFHNWIIESKDASMSIINKFKTQNKIVDRFTVIVFDKNTRLGCAMLQTVEGQNTIYLLVCNYARNNRIGEPVYMKGKTASGCKNGKNSKFKGLCSIKEKIDPNAISQLH